jgi:hypothetical protein
MWPNAVVDFFNQYWPDIFVSQYWSYATLAASVVVLLLLWKTWKRVRNVEAQVQRLRADLRQIQIIESRRQLAEMKSAPIVTIETNDTPDDLSIIPTANSGQPLDVHVDGGKRPAV